MKTKALALLLSLIAVQNASASCAQYTCAHRKVIPNVDELSKNVSYECGVLSNGYAPYTANSGGDFRGALFKDFGSYIGIFDKSDFRCATFENLNGTWSFSGSDLRSADLSKIGDLSMTREETALKLILKDALFNDETKLPFSKAEALKQGMIFRQ